MKLNDALLGVVVMIFGGAIILGVQGMPRIPHVPYTASFFPSIVGTGLLGCGLVLIVSGLARREGGWVQLGEWARSPAHIGNMLLVLAAVVFYILVAETLGFLLTAMVILFVLIWRLWGHPGCALLIAVAGTLATQLFFGKVLLVPLPWGFLEPLRGQFPWTYL